LPLAFGKAPVDGAQHPDAVGGRADDRRGIAGSGAAADARPGMVLVEWKISACSVHRTLESEIVIETYSTEPGVADSLAL